MRGSRPQRVWVCTVIGLTVLAGALRAPYAVAPNARQSPDEAGYVRAATRLADTGRYGRESLHWPPGAPAMFAAAARTGGGVGRGARPDIRAAYWAQWTVGTALVPVVFGLAALIGGMWAGTAAAATVATYPPLVAVTGDLLSEPLGALLLTAALCALVWAGAARWRGRRLLLAGVLLGAAVLTRANFLLIVPAVGLAVAVAEWREGRLKRGLAVAALFSVSALVPVGLWSLNASVGSGQVVPITNVGGMSFFIGTFLPGDGTMAGMKSALKTETIQFAPEVRHVRRAEDLPLRRVFAYVASRHPGLPRDAALRREAWRNLRTYPRRDPAGFARMTLAKVPRLWLKPSPRRPGLRSTPMRLWHLLITLGALAGLTAGLVRTGHPGLWAVAAALVAFTVFHLVVEAMPRYGLPALPALIAAGSAGWALAFRSRTLPEPANPNHTAASA